MTAVAAVLAPPRDPCRYAPVVVLAAARSYSSVVSAMLGAHPGLYAFPELVLFSEQSVGEVVEAPPYLPSALSPEARSRWRAAPGLRRAVAEVLGGGQGVGELAWADRYLRARGDWTGAELLDQLFGAISPLVGVEKSPETVRYPENLQRALEWYPRAKFVHLVRHPVTYMQSVQVQLMMFDHPEVAARSWLSINRRVEEFCAWLPPGQAIRVRAEDVLAGDREVLAAISRLGGVADDGTALEAMLHPETSPYAGTPGAAGLGGLDPVFLSNPVLRPPARPGPLAALNGVLPGLAAEVAELARHYGYS